jgi:hypothetical protein
MKIQRNNKYDSHKLPLTSVTRDFNRVLCLTIFYYRSVAVRRFYGEHGGHGTEPPQSVT